MNLSNLWLGSLDVVFVAIYVVTGVVAGTHVLLFKTNSLSAASWLVFIVVLPVAGALVYWFFGINRVWNAHLKSRAPQWTDQGLLPAPSAALEAIPDPFQRVGQRITARPVIEGHQMSLLVNGEQAFPEMLAAIDAAHTEVFLCTYIFDDDSVGQRFVRALSAAQARGARVRVLLDDLGRRTARPGILSRLRQQGISTACFMPLKLLPPSLSSNLRNHRKMLIVDGAVAFAGGMNIGERQLYEGASKLRTADIHFRIEGSIVAELRQLFLTDWASSGGAPLDEIEQRDSTADTAGDLTCRLIADGPDEALDHLALAIAGIISAARQRVLIMSPYFLPDRRLLGALQCAALRGVEIRILIPERSNWPITRWALNHSLLELLTVGVSVLERPGIFAHSKCLLVDDRYALVGSANLDARSLRLNFELGIEVLGASLPKALEQYFIKMAAVARPVRPETLIHRSLPIRLRDAVAALFSPYL